MVELKFSAKKSNGQPITGTLTAAKYAEAKRKVNNLVEKNQLKLVKLERKSTYIYKAQRGKEKPVNGELKAFNKKEVDDALTKLGYKPLSIIKKLLDFQRKPPVNDIVSFVKISADLLNQKLAYGDILNLLINDTLNSTLRNTLKDISNELKKGTDSQMVFLKYQDVFGKFTAYMLGLASKSGNMAEIYMATVRFLERNQEFRKSLRSALVTPMVTVFVLLVAVMFYVGYIFPETAKLFERFKMEVPPMTAFTLKISNFMIDYPLVIAAIFLGPPILFIIYIKTPKGGYFFDKYKMKAPIMGSIIHKTLIEIFCRVFYTLYSGSAESIEPIRIAAEATDNKYFEDRIKNVAIPMMTQRGIGISEAFEATGIFTETAISRFHSGEETGTIKETAIQLANYYETETVYKLKNLIELVQVVIAMIIMIVMILLTLVSAETAVVSPKQPGETSIIYNIDQNIV